MITSLDQVTEFPLCWPDFKPRTAQRKGSSQFKTTMAKAQREIEEEMKRWPGCRYVLSMAPKYRQGPVDPGAALWWALPPRGPDGDRELRVIACDNWPWQEDNLHAIALTLKHMRAFERYGTYSKEQAAEGARLMLPPPESERAPDWRKLFGHLEGIPNDKQLVLVEHEYRTKSREANGDAERQTILNLAIEAARKELA